MSITLIVGGARSGKSKRAEALAEASGKPVVYIATAPQMDDAEWQQRVVKHQQQRPDEWKIIEEPLLLAELIEKQCGVCVLADCLTLWLSNILYAELETEPQVKVLCQSLEASKCDVILVSNEVGMGLVPDTQLGRKFRDEQGRLNQAVAKVADRVEFIIAGLPLKLKP